MASRKHFDFPFVGNSADTAVLFAQTTTAGPSNTTTATSLLGNGLGVKTLPAGFLYTGIVLQFSLMGYYSTMAGSPGNLTVSMLLGATAVATTGAVALTASVSNLIWALNGIITCGQAGSGTAGQVWSQGIFSVNTAAQTQAAWQMVNTAVNTLDTTLSQAIDVQATFSVANAGNVMTATNSLITFYN